MRKRINHTGDKTISVDTPTDKSVLRLFTIHGTEI